MKSMFFAICFLFSSLSHAALIQFSSDNTTYQIGDTVTVSVLFSDFSTTVGGVDFEFSYMPSLLDLLSWELGNAFDDGLGSFPFVDSSIRGFFYFSDIADAAADEGILAANQGRQFTLATLRFQALDVGNVQLRFLPFVLFAQDLNYNEIDVISTDLSFDIAAAQVPAPATALLLLAGLACLYRRQQQK